MKAQQRDLVESLRPAGQVVVVDDHSSFRRSASTLLTSDGFEVVGEAPDRSGRSLVSEVAPELAQLEATRGDAR